VATRKAILTPEQKQRAIDYLMTFGTDHGRRVLDDLEARCYLHRTTMTAPRVGMAVDPHRTAYYEGMRAAVLTIKHEIQRAKLDEKPIQAVALTEPKKEEV